MKTKSSNKTYLKGTDACKAKPVCPNLSIMQNNSPIVNNFTKLCTENLSNSIERKAWKTLKSYIHSRKFSDH